MLKVIICGLLLSVTQYIQCFTSDYEYHPIVGGWLKLHKVPATWQQAFLQCHNEGSLLASPITKELQRAMQIMIDNNDYSLSYFIGANSKFTPGQYVSIEGVPLANMPVENMYKLLDTERGECLQTDGFNISVTSCTTRLPYLCYMKADGKQLTECGTFDKQYRFEPSTGSCYKVHIKFATWVEANAVCVSEGSYLAIVNNKEEAQIITKLIPDMRVSWGTTKDWEPLFVGMLDWTGHGTWMTIHGDEFDDVFNVWQDNEPSTADNDADRQLCVGLIRTGKYDNIWCDSHEGYFICEKDPKTIRYSNKTKPKIPPPSVPKLNYHAKTL